MEILIIDKDLEVLAQIYEADSEEESNITQTKIIKNLNVCVAFLNTRIQVFKQLNLIKTQKLGREIRIKPTLFGNSIYFQLKKIRGMIKNAN